MDTIIEAEQQIPPWVPVQISTLEFCICSLVRQQEDIALTEREKTGIE